MSRQIQYILVAVITFVACIHIISLPGISSAAEVKSLKSYQKDRDIVLEYTLKAQGSERTDTVTFKISIDRGKTWKTPRGVIGDVGKRVSVGSGKNIIWSVLEEFPKGLDHKVIFKVEAAGEKQRKAKGPKEWTDPVTGMEFVWVPGGCFQMGQTESEKAQLIKEAGKKNYDKYYGDELPRHEVCVDGLWMSKHEVTRDHFRRFVESSAYKTDAEKQGWSWIWTDKWEKKQGADWRNVGFDQNDRHPVVNVSWNDAKAMAEWMSKQGNGKFRLPTEAEWEYAGRAGTTTSRSWGDNPDDACRYANVHDLTSKRVNKFDWTHHNCDDGYAVTSPVGSFTPNRFGLYDMLGNVWEWCEDIYSEDAYRKHQRNNPIYTEGGTLRVLRGGSWYNSPRYVRSANRGRHEPGNRNSLIGFRLVRTE